MDRAEEVWRDALVAWDNGWRDDQAAVSVIRTAMEAYAAEKVAEALAAGKRAGMERAAEIAEDAHNATGLRWTPKAIAQAIRSENDG